MRFCTKIKKFGLLFLLVICYAGSWSQLGVIEPSYIDSLNQMSVKDSLSVYERINFGERALKLANEVKYEEGEFDALMNIGICHLNLSNYKEALDHFQRAQLLAQKMDKKDYLAESTFFIGNVHSFLSNFDKAQKVFEESLQIYEDLDKPGSMGYVKNGLGVVYSNAGHPEMGLKAFKEALAIFEENEMEQETAIPINNIGDHFWRMKQPEMALGFFEKSLELDQKYSSKKGEAISLCNIGLCMRDLKQYSKALDYFEKGLQLAKEEDFSKVIYDIYKDVADTYKAMGDYENALVFHEQYSNLRDSVYDSEKNAQIADLWVQYDSQKKDRDLIESQKQIVQLQQNKKIERLTSYILTGGILFLLIIGFLLYSRNKVKQELVEIELKNSELEGERLKKELDSKHQDLTNFALDISRKNEFSNQIHEALKTISNSGDPEFRKKKIRNLLILASNHLKLNDDIKEFQMNVEKVNQDFFYKLDDYFPDITNTEKQLCGLIRLNLSTKDIASIRNISPKSVEMSRYRLRKKLNLKPEEEITSFLQGL